MNIVFQTPKDEGETVRKSITVNKIILDLPAGNFEVQTLHNDNRVFVIGVDTSATTSGIFAQLQASLAQDIEAKYTA